MTDEELQQGIWDAVELAVCAYRANAGKSRWGDDILQQLAVSQSTDQILGLIVRWDEENEDEEPWSSSARDVDT